MWVECILPICEGVAKQSCPSKLSNGFDSRRRGGSNYLQVALQSSSTTKRLTRPNWTAISLEFDQPLKAEYRRSIC
ncbi:unnamed protein product [Rodentolepis nana]|uniref:Uncharacterized protein n=1 Tax=Rodentolepis nana TaxID=102285 RepID=A0A0R3TE22_RODNA|nr:unnamed protein product [Rodentolepis nana]